MVQLLHFVFICNLSFCVACGEVEWWNHEHRWASVSLENEPIDLEGKITILHAFYLLPPFPGYKDVVLHNHILSSCQNIHLSILPLSMWIDLYALPDMSKGQQISQALHKKFVVFLVSPFFVGHATHLGDVDIHMLVPDFHPSPKSETTDYFLLPLERPAQVSHILYTCLWLFSQVPLLSLCSYHKPVDKTAFDNYSSMKVLQIYVDIGFSK